MENNPTVQAAKRAVDDFMKQPAVKGVQDAGSAVKTVYDGLVSGFV